MRLAGFAVVIVLASTVQAFANGGAWQTGVPGSGSASASTSEQRTDVAVEQEALRIDLHWSYAAVEVRYRMRNTGPKIDQNFFFPVERWQPTTDGENRPLPDVEDYHVTADGAELAATTIAGKNGSGQTSTTGELWQEKVSTIKSWKKSVIPFAADQVREVTVRYRAKYSENNESVSDDAHISDATFAYSLSPAATWKGPIRKGKIEINILHPEPEDVSIAKPKNRFRKTSPTHYEWSFENLKPSLADDIRIVAHSKYDSYYAGALEDAQQSFVIRGSQYFYEHTNYTPTASSTLAGDKDHNYEVKNLRNPGSDTTWVEGVEGDGIGENILLEVEKPQPLYGILIQPGYHSVQHEDLWSKNNRVAELEITLNDDHTFTEKIPDERFENPYLIRVRDYSNPVKKVKMTIKAVHRGTKFRDTCISSVALRVPLAKKPEVNPAR